MYGTRTGPNASGQFFREVVIQMYRNNSMYYRKYLKVLESTFGFSTPLRLVAGDSATGAWKVLDNYGQLVLASNTNVTGPGTIGVFETIYPI